MPGLPISFPQADLDDLQRRLHAARWPDSVAEAPDWSWGTPPGALRALVDRWRGGYDWRATEDRLNTHEHGVFEAPAASVHYFRMGTRGATPLLLIHGWPDSPLRFEKAASLLADRFDLILPSVPGYGLSGRPTHPGMTAHAVADLFADLMESLGFDRFGVHGGDIGSGIGEAIALRHPERVHGLHLVDVPFWHRYAVDPATLADEEQAYFDAMTAWAASEGAYAALHRTKPQTVSYALNDSPIGLAAWMLEKYHAWSDHPGDVWSALPLDEVLDQITLYWLTQTIGSSIRYYREMAATPNDPDARVSVPTAFTIFPKDIPPAPRAFAERFFEVAHWARMPGGGHFGAWEKPDLFAREIRTFFDSLA